MKTKQFPIYLFFFVLGCFPVSRVHAQEPPDFNTILKLLNVGSPGEPRYYEGDIAEADRHSLDLNGDGINEYVAVPNSGCGETNNCSFYILGAEKKKGWRVLVRGEGKITNLTPYGFVVSPRKTNGFADLIAVWDQGPEPDGTRSLDRRIFVFNGIQYERFEEAYPPPGSPSELNALMKQVDQLKYQRRGKLKAQGK